MSAAGVFRCIDAGPKEDNGYVKKIFFSAAEALLLKP